MTVNARAPLRISFGGGGTDVSPYCEDFGGCVVNATMNHYIWASMTIRQDKQITIDAFDLPHKQTYRSLRELTHENDTDIVKVVIRHFHPKFGLDFFLRSDVPPQAGLGGSAAAFVAVIGVFNHLRQEKKLGNYEIAELAYSLERKILKNPGGRQDQYATVFGGMNFIEFKGNDFVRVNPLRLERSTTLELERRLVLVNIGARKKSGDVIQDQIRRYVKKSTTSVAALHATKKIAHLMKFALLRGDLPTFGRLLDKAWLEKKKFTPLVSNTFIDHIYAIARKHGAYGGKITGAGGGGHMHFFCKPNKEQHVSRALEQAGVRVIDFSLEPLGFETWELAGVTGQ